MNRKSNTTKTTKTKKSETTDEVFVKEPANLLSQIKIDIKHKNETQKKLIQAIKNNDVTICTGPAGTGKTLLSVFEALLLLKNQPEIYKEIKLVKSITQLKNEELGTLPGDEKDKLKFHMMSYLDAFHKLIGEFNTNKLIEIGVIKMEVFGAIRGRSFTNAIIIIDEFQNISHDNAKTFLTRFSDNTKVIVLGDSGQIDLRDKRDSSLERLAQRVKANPIEGVSVVEFSETEVVRHRLTTYFIGMFKEPEIVKIKPAVSRSQPTPKNNFLKLKEWFKKLFN
jgi:phosphate starvation-inducible PhoH-like protein